MNSSSTIQKEQEVLLTAGLRLTVTSYLPLEDAMKMKLLRKKDARHFNNSAIAREGKRLVLKFEELQKYFDRDDFFKRFFLNKVDLSQMIHLNLYEFSHKDERHEQVMAHLFEMLP